MEQGGSVESSFPAPPTYIWKGGEGGADYPVDNYEGESFGGSLNLVDATRLSVNTVYAQAAKAVGPPRLVERAAALGITSPLAPDASLVLGTAQVSPLEMASAYSTLARGGTRIPPRLLGKVTDADGGSVEGSKQDGPSRAVSEDTAAVVTEVLRRVVDKGTGTAARLDRPAAGKTGTTNKNADAWFVGYTASPRLTTAVWMGWSADGSRPMDRVRGRPVSGGGIPAQIWEKFMAAATKGAPPGDFDEPPPLSAGDLLQGSGRVRAAPAGDLSPSPALSSGPAATTARAAGGGSTTSSSRSGPGSTSTSAVPGPAATTALARPTSTTRREATTTTRPNRVVGQAPP